MDIVAPFKKPEHPPLFARTNYGTALFGLVSIPMPMIAAIIHLRIGHLFAAEIAKRILYYFEASRHLTNPRATPQ
jgi:hypothetical protein